ncbi:TPA: gamma-glutamylcyclotransferase [Candidatus Micrarchaeota archaeon]|nr:gamma-glutamylcyclotransferase [Candidatus Micrarchaeota archaeon]
MPNLFAYGMLMNDSITKRVTGRVFPKKKALLENYEKIMPGTGYSYILPKAGSTVEGYILYGIDEEIMAKIDRYEAEGDLYDRKEVEVIVQGRRERAYAYVGNLNGLNRFFGPEVYTDVRIKEYLERKLKDLTDLEDQESTDLVHRAKAELLGDKIEVLISAHFRRSADLRYLIDKILYKPTLPTLEGIKSDPEALKYADAYIKLTVKHVIFNQLERMIGNAFAGEITMEPKFHQRTLSNLIALIFMNRKSSAIDKIMEAIGANRLSMDKDYLDYAVMGIRIADMIFDPMEIKEIIEWMRGHRHPGKVPLGAEIEMSDIGARAVDALPGEDSRYDSFYYFNDFDLLHRCWKLGGHVDDHSGVEEPEGRTRGFFEYSLGKTGTIGDFSKPVTDDPWVLNQLINQAVLFADVLPHSFHITLDAQGELDMTRPSDPKFLICLLLLCGDIEPDKAGYLHETRICNCEIVDKYGRLHFSDENIHFASEEDEEERFIGRSKRANLIEYKFMRLKSNHNYEPFILALKGFQLGYNPRPLGSTFRSLDEFKFPEIEALREWAERPRPLSKSTLMEFLHLVREGLMREDEGRPAHPIDYIEYNLKKIERKLDEMNELIGSGRRRG